MMAQATGWWLYGTFLLGSGFLFVRLQDEAHPVPLTVIQSALALLAPGGFMANSILILSVTKFEPRSGDEEDGDSD